MKNFLTLLSLLVLSCSSDSKNELKLENFEVPDRYLGEWVTADDNKYLLNINKNYIEIETEDGIVDLINKGILQDTIYTFTIFIGEKGIGTLDISTYQSGLNVYYQPKSLQDLIWQKVYEKN